MQRPLKFRTRLFAMLLLFAIVPAVLVTLLWGITFGSTMPLFTHQAGWDSVAVTGRHAVAAAQTAPLTPAQREAFRVHERTLSASLEQVQRLRYLLRNATGIVVLTSLFVLAAITYGASRVAGHLSRQLSRPIDELVEWTEIIRRGDPLPALPRRQGAPEFGILRQRLRTAAMALDLGRQRAMEAERLRAFRESARQVAHELKNPLTPMRFAIARLRREVQPDLVEAIDVLSTETERLERTARSFAQFGRLPEGPPSEVDVSELVRYAATATIPETMTLHLYIDPELPFITGYHDALAGALSNVLLNAVDACHGKGSVTVQADRTTLGDQSAVRVKISDDGPGIPAETLHRIWEPYVTHKAGGTGLGLAIARQTIWAHHGSVTAESVVGSGTSITFTVPIHADADRG